MDLLENGTDDEKAELSFKFITYGEDTPFRFNDFCSWVHGVIGMYSSITGGEGNEYS